MSSTAQSAVVVGAGRSGTSLVAGLLVDAGFTVDHADLIPPSDANPTGYFEQLSVNRLNDELLAPHLALSAVSVPRRLSWLAALPIATPIGPEPRLFKRMAGTLPPGRFCLKDPRLSYTLDAWRPVIGEADLICVFRDPARFAHSIFRDARRDPGCYRGYPDSPHAVWAMWTSCYDRILNRHSTRGHWLFTDADDLVATGETDRLAAFLDTPVSCERISRVLCRSRPLHPVPRATRRVYDALRTRSEQPGG